MTASAPAQPTAGDDRVEPGMLPLLGCPNCAARPPLRPSEDGATLACDVCVRAYPVLPGGIPDLRPEGDDAPAPALSAATANNTPAADGAGPARTR
jgi:uncharacterized protein YbaR (Trm112 family)